MTCKRRNCCTRAIEPSFLWFLICPFCVLGFTAASSAQTLENAFKVELDRLTAEKNSILGAIEKSKIGVNEKRGNLIREIESLSRTLTTLQANNNSQELQLPQTSRLQSLQAQERKVDRRARQIETWLETHGISISEDAVGVRDGPAEHEHPPLDVMMKAALDHVEEHGQLWVRTNQEYFDEYGKAQTGSVLRIAEVGAVLTTPKFQPLSLASDGSLRSVPGTQTLDVLEEDTRTIDVVLFDPTDARTIQFKTSTWRTWLDRGGAVMWVIAVLALIALLLLVERTMVLTRFFVRVSSFDPLKNDQIAENDRLFAPVRLVRAATGAFDEIEQAAVNELLNTKMFVRRGISTLPIVASVAPLLGLLGTVTGMIATFGMITEHGTGDPRILSGGISEALLTTQFGLMVAIPALLSQALLYRFGDVIVRRIELHTIMILNGRSLDQVAINDALDRNSAVGEHR